MARLRRIVLLVALAACRGDDITAPRTPITPGDDTPPPILANQVNTAPTPLFSVSPRWPRPGDTVTVDASFSVDGEGQVTAYQWNLGNGTTQVTSAVARTVYRSAGTYTVSLVAVDDSGATATASLDLVVGDAGAPATAVSAAQSTVTLGAASTASGAPVTATVTVRDGSGTAIAGVPVRVGSAGRAMAIVQPSAVTPANGTVTAPVQSRVAQGTTVRAIADFTLLTAEPALTVVPAAVSTSRSALRLTDPVVPSGADSTLLEVTARDADGNPIGGSAVTVNVSGGTATVRNEGATDAAGRRVVTIIPTTCNGTALTVQATVGGVTMPATPAFTASGALAYGQCGAALWFDATDAATTIASGTTLTEWRDRAGGARHAPTAAGPAIVADGINGRRALDFNGSSHFIPIADVVSGAPLTIFVVERRASGPGAGDRMMLGGLGCCGNRNLHLGYRADTLAYYAFWAADVQARIPGFAGAAEPARLWAARWQPGAQQLHIDAAPMVGSGNTVGLLEWSGAAIGRYNLPNTWYHGRIGEVLFFRRRLDETERRSVELQLMAKWGIGTLALTAGDAQTAPVGTAVPVDPRVRVTDGAGLPIPNATITWQVTAGNGSVATSTSSTDGDGYASTGWTLGATPGTNTLVAWYGTSAGMGRSVTFTATGQTCAYGACGVALWFDASDAATVTTGAGNVLTEWRDKSGFARHASASAGPTLLSAGINGRPALRFNGSSTFVPITDVVSGSPFTVFIVERRGGGGSQYRMMLGGSGTTAASNLHIGYQSSTQAWFGFYGSDLPGAVPAYVAGAEPVRVWGARWTSGARRLHVNVAQLGSDANTTGLVSWADPRIGHYAPLNHWYAGEIGEVLVYRRALSDAERAAVERALMVRWGAGTFAIDAGNGQSADAGTSPSIAPRVRLTDATGSGLANAVVTWQVTAGGGRLNGGTQIQTATDANGYTNVPAGQWIIDAGTNGLTAWLSQTAGQGQSVAFTATGTLPAGVLARFDASDAASLLASGSCTGAVAAANDQVNCWLDRSGNVNHAWQSTANSAPVISPAAINGRTALGFTLARANWLAVTAASVRALRSQSRTVFAAARVTSWTAAPTERASAIAIWPGWHSGLYFDHQLTTGRALSVHWSRADSGVLVVSERAGVASGRTHVATELLRVTGGTSFETTVFLDGTAGNTSAGTDPSAGGATDLRIGQANVAPRTDYLWRFDGAIGELLVYPRALTSDERRQVERYLGWKWGVTIP